MSEREPPLTTVRPAYRVVRGSLHLYLRLVHGMRVHGAEHLPAEGGVTVVSNHQSFLDIPLLAAATPRHLAFVARDTLARSRPLAWLMRECGAILIKRNSSDRGALRDMVEHLELGDGVVVFPEGTRTSDGSVGDFRAGALFAAAKAGCPIVPVGIRGAFEAYGRGHRVPRPFRPISVHFGPPLPPRATLEEVHAAVLALVGDGRHASRSSGPAHAAAPSPAAPSPAEERERPPESPSAQQRDVDAVPGALPAPSTTPSETPDDPARAADRPAGR